MTHVAWLTSPEQMAKYLGYFRYAELMRIKDIDTEFEVVHAREIELLRELAIIFVLSLQQESV